MICHWKENVFLKVYMATFSVVVNMIESELISAKFKVKCLDSSCKIVFHLLPWEQYQAAHLIWKIPHIQKLYYSAHFNGLTDCGGSAYYFCKVIIIVKDRAEWLKNLKTTFYLWSYFSTISSPLWPHVWEVSSCMGFYKQILGIHCWTASLCVLLYLCSSQCWTHKISALVALPKREGFYLSVKYINFTIFRSEIWGYV